MLTVFINEGIKMDKCPKNMTLVALNIFGLITILDFFQDTFVSIFKTKRPSDYFAFFSFLLCGGQAYFYIFVFGLLGSTTGRWPHFFFFFLQEEMNDNTINDFGTFLNIFNDSLNKACKLEVPRTSKRTIQNNPWITSGIIVAISHCDKRYNCWVKYRKKKCKEDETDNRGGTCLCNICNDKRKHYTAYKEYRKTLKRVRKNARSKFYTGKFNEKSGDMKKTWELINSIRGKGKRQIKPQFIIDNEKITNRRVIANEFNKYFVSLATNLNEAYNEIGELTVNFN